MYKPLIRDKTAIVLLDYFAIENSLDDCDSRAIDFLRGKPGYGLLDLGHFFTGSAYESWYGLIFTRELYWHYDPVRSW